MVIRRDEAASFVSEEMQSHLKQFEAAIDQQLREQWFPGHTVTVCVPEGLGMKRRWYMEEISRRYTEAGWGVEMHLATDQRDSDYFRFS